MYALIGDARQKLDYLSERLGLAGQDRLKILHNRLDLIESRLSVVSPLDTLERGYCIARSPRGIITRAGEVLPGEVIEIQLADGRLRCRVLDLAGEKGDFDESEG
jgi:exodeoxyribonuclease VII large subunit